MINHENDIVVRKLNIEGKQTWSYPGRVIERTADTLLLEARFNRPDLPFHGVTFRENDRFVEWYFTDRWYNIDEIHDRDTDQLKCWYCNVTRPAVIADGSVSYVDLALDLLVFPDGRQLVLDEDEFAELPLDDQDRQRAREALQELKEMEWKIKK